MGCGGADGEGKIGQSRMKIIRLLLNSTGTLEEVDGGSSCQLRWEVGKNSAVLLPRHLAHLIFLMRAACTHTCWCTCWFFLWSCYSFGQLTLTPSHTHTKHIKIIHQSTEGVPRLMHYVRKGNLIAIQTVY